MISDDGLLDAAGIFGRIAPLMLEIGFGTGNALLRFAKDHPETNCVGIEVYQPGIGSALQEIEAQALSNVRLVEGDARRAVASMFAEQSLIHVQILFPDPWPKRRHRKRRLIQSEYVSLIVSRLQGGGELRLATDHAPYAEDMLKLCEAEPFLVNQAGTGNFAADSGDRPKTRFERRGEALGNEIFELRFRRMG